MLVFRKIILFFCASFVLLNLTAASKFGAKYRSGLRKIKAKDFKGAQVELQKAYDHAELSSEEVKVLFALASVNSSLKSFKKTKENLEKILEIPDLKHSDKLKVYKRLISCNIRLKNYPEAFSTVNLGLTSAVSDDEKVDFFYERSKVYEKQKKFATAIKILQDALDLSNEFSKKWQETQFKIVNVMFKNRQYEKILEVLDEINIKKINGYPKQMICYYAGQSAWRLRKYIKAAECFELISDKGASWLCFAKNNQLGQCWSKLKKYEKAYNCFKRLADNIKLQNYYRANGILMMAEMRLKQKKYREAKILCEKVKKFPKASASQVKRAETLLSRIKPKLK